jgi:6,7-dimethyl-8-ribityllumazine synthase
MAKPRKTKPRRTGARIAVIVSRYNASVTDALKAGALAAIRTRGGSASVIDAPGSYELPVLALAAAESWEFDGVVALGCLIRGETRHDRYIADAVAHGLMQVSMKTGKPCGFGVITAETAGQAAARAGGAKGNKGQEAADAVLDAVEAVRRLRAEAMLDDGWRMGSSRELPDKAGRGTGKRARKGGRAINLEDIPF